MKQRGLKIVANYLIGKCEIKCRKEYYVSTFSRDYIREWCYVMASHSACLQECCKRILRIHGYAKNVIPCIYASRRYAKIRERYVGAAGGYAAYVGYVDPRSYVSKCNWSIGKNHLVKRIC